MGRASTEIGMRFRVFDQTAAGFAAVKRRFAQWDKTSVLNRELNPLAGFGKTNLAKGAAAGFKDVAGVGNALGGGAAMAGRLAGSLAKAAATAWQNLMGGMLKSFEASFGRIDRWLLGMWEDMAAGARIAWLEISANGPAVFQTFFRNAEALASGFFKNWKEGFSWVFDTLITGATSMAMGFARLGKAVWASLKGDDADWAGVANAFKSVIPDYGGLADRLGVELEKTKLIDLSEEKARIRAAAAERKLQDRESLEAADRLQKQTSDNMSDGLIKGAQALKEAVKDSEAAAMGSYDAFRLVMGRAGAAQGAAAASPLAGQGPAPGGASDSASGTFPAMLARLDTIIGYLRDGGRDRTYIRDAVESIGVA